jgi:glycosyltransferase involved in cell wall biosynthesis
MNHKNTVSVIIPTFNRSKQLKVCLDSISRQNFKECFELIVVDDGSTDDTKKVIFLFSRENKKNIKVNYIYQKNQGCAVARNTGIQNAKGEYLFFTDDDCVVPKDWVVKILEGFKKYPEASAVGGWYEVEKDVLEKNKYLKALHIQRKTYFENYESYEYVSSTGFKKNLCGNTANVCYKKEVFEKIGYFDAWTRKTARIDWEFKIRAHYSGLTLVYVPIIVNHNKTMTLYGFLYNAFRYGQADYYLSTRFKGYNNIVTLSNLFYALEDINNKFPKDNLFYNFLFLFVQIIGSSIFKTKSTIRFEKKIQSEETFKKEDIINNTKEICTYVNGYFSSNEKIKKGNEAVEMLEKEYKKPLISIIIPFYNRPEYITKLFIESINGLFCSSSSVELIFVDDGSTDNTLEILNGSVVSFRFATKVFTKNNGGPSSARNLGIKNAIGDYIFFTDSDITVPKFWLRDFLTAFLYNSDISLVGGSQQNYSPRTVFDSWRNSKSPKFKQFFLTNSLFWEDFLPCDTANMAIKNNQNFFFDEKYTLPGYEDFDFVYTIKKQNKMVCYIPFFVSNLRSMGKNDYTRMIKSRGVGYKIFMAKYKDYHFVLNNYSVLAVLFKGRLNIFKVLECKNIFTKMFN